jgi:hypothetical protein
MRSIYYFQKLERTLQLLELKKQRLKREKDRNIELKRWFYKDLFERSPNDPNLISSIENRRNALLKHGYFNINGEITEKGFDKLISFAIQQSKHTLLSKHCKH